MDKWRPSVSEEYFDRDIVDYIVSYPRLPEELERYVFGFLGIGPCVMAILESDFQDTLKDEPLDKWEVSVPCKLFKELKYRFYQDYIIAEDPPIEDWEEYYEPDLW